MYASVNQIIIGLNNGMSPVQYQAIISISNCFFLIEPLGTIFWEFLSKYNKLYTTLIPKNTVDRTTLYISIYLKYFNNGSQVITHYPK